MTIEKPHYDLIKKQGIFEARNYSGYITASVKIKSSSYNQAVYLGFNYLGDYIYGSHGLYVITRCV